ncbi:calcium-binding protein E63-1 isoform X1 [Drosophila miranda]|uniref:Calcium-binding protein E63-1 isoform X1 n=2 Tax=Drosophila pseudoobscura pseudoobscura TaxID=46245 RepID=B5DQZ8_DROPS|nr:calcium-binding protein E63-1 isoform X1 [Drosophila pseudoobscura]XP_015043553.1 calcium-binding protein E63-1 isoform X2 [Drosophila pseudoobscura]XP_017138700.1 calcium-binding protein E63-1 isoform X1 [Drosophila miranda]XP_026849724.1 calcium-binding protein E63-1 isoform X1 [Drosophila persimilis]
MSPMSGLRHQLKMLGTALLGKRATKSVKKKPFTEVEITDLRTAFDLLDRNRDGRVTANELQFMLKNLGINVRDEIIHDLIREASHSGNGLINEAEFLQWVGRIQALRDEQQQHDDNPSNSKPLDEADDVTEDLIAAFRVFDRDGNGFITRDELQTAMEMIGEPLNEQQLEQLLAIADLDQDGRINYEEFTRLLL